VQERFVHKKIKKERGVKIMKKKRNNKGFSLVELIVVMAIMAILAVTLAPSLTKYVEKSRKAADKEVVNSIYTAVEYAILDEKILADAATLIDGTGLSLNANAPVNTTDTTDVRTSEVYDVISKTWKSNGLYTGATNSFIQEIFNVVGNFKLKSTVANGATDIIIKYEAGVLSVELKYGGTSSTTDYIVSSSEVR
jgi:type IV pilus assembly protein PilA